MAVVPVLRPMDLMVEATPRRVFANAHTYHINSISVNSDYETYMSADDLRINLWNFEIINQSFNPPASISPSLSGELAGGHVQGLCLSSQEPDSMYLDALPLAGGCRADTNVVHGTLPPSCTGTKWWPVSSPLHPEVCKEEREQGLEPDHRRPMPSPPCCLAYGAQRPTGPPTSRDGPNAAVAMPDAEIVPTRSAAPRTWGLSGALTVQAQAFPSWAAEPQRQEEGPQDDNAPPAMTVPRPRTNVRGCPVAWTPLPCRRAGNPAQRTMPAGTPLHPVLSPWPLAGTSWVEAQGAFASF
ncbi:UNVERIFIED_CONTAM: hypothetical protein K2H54_030817 [Gekko kuhli]